MENVTRMGHAVCVKHTFEAAHRLPHLGGKCVNLHGHSWEVEVTVGAPRLSEGGTVVEFGALKQGVRRWIDLYWDHATLLGQADPLVGLLRETGSRVYRFGAPGDATGAELVGHDLLWPTVESVAVVLARAATAIVDELPGAQGARVTRVEVRETRSNTAVHEPEWF
ncbi:MULTISPECIES: 6-carboxytetrahydropterin synthase [Actinosynnema]|uniref:6-pyruvoyl trahydropterin synthase family protein n=1 Tax=Actinosynnema TaxID=40566 RepID=UPI0020A42852|nr:6-carboxytetrahydropterin synthase [Actinosynnema pretiosum]MCP2098112.1 6-pyruvoyltetrahydropterin/6-carboxytetrahydropterin synthase [Actinosynnema pretiosum]